MQQEEQKHILLKHTQLVYNIVLLKSVQQPLENNGVFTWIDMWFQSAVSFLNRFFMNSIWMRFALNWSKWI